MVWSVFFQTRLVFKTHSLNLQADIKHSNHFLRLPIKTKLGSNILMEIGFPFTVGPILVLLWLCVSKHKASHNNKNHSSRILGCLREGEKSDL